MEYKSFWPGWETVRLIGRGSFGAVYEIQRKVFDDTEKAALKMITIPQNISDIEEMHGDGYDDESITATFQSHLKSIVAEYSLMRKMSGCVNIVNCDDVRYVQHDDKIGWDIFIKMELLMPLTKVLPAQIPEDMVIKLGVDMCSALEMCNRYDIIHRDIKPQNIFVSADGTYKLGDFGIAKTVEKTMGGTKIGTYKYMAPEVYHNHPYGSSADIYSLGLVLYWMLNERRMPFLPLPPAKLSATAEDQARQRRFSGETIPPPAHGSEDLKKIVLKACAYNPKERYKSAAEMMRNLNALAAPAEITVAKESVPMPHTPHSSHAGIAQRPKTQKVQSPKTDIRIRFLNADGTVIQSRTYSPGEYISAPNMVPEFEHEGFRYHFAGWIPEVPATAIESMDCQVFYERAELLRDCCSTDKTNKMGDEKKQPKEEGEKNCKKRNKKFKLMIAACLLLCLIVGTLTVWHPRNENQLLTQKRLNQEFQPDSNISESKITLCENSGHKWKTPISGILAPILEDVFFDRGGVPLFRKCAECGKVEHLEKLVFPDSGGYESYKYDTHGRLIQKKFYTSDGTAKSPISYEYDNLDKLIRRTAYTTDSKNPETGEILYYHTFEYDKVGNLIYLRLGKENRSFSSYYSYQYDDGNRLIKREEYISNDEVTNWMGNYTAFSYNESGQRVSSQTYYWDEKDGEASDRDYSAEGHLVKVSKRVGDKISSIEGYEYDTNGSCVRYISYKSDGTVSSEAIPQYSSFSQ